MSDINVIVNDEIVNIDVIDEPVLVNVVNSPGVPGAPGQGVPVGGTTGQVLAKNSNTNYDTEWVDVSGGVWGTITGTLSNQTDLQNALNAKFDDPTGTTSQYIRGDGSLATFPSLTGYVPYTGATTNVNLGTHRITAQNATIASSGSGDTVTLNHSSGSGNGLTITKGGNGEGLYINKTGGSGNAATIIGTINATTLVKSGGTSSQFLKADGTVDSSVYVPTSTTLTINGVSYDLSANRSWTVSGGISGSGASGQVSYWDGTTSQAGSADLTWNGTNIVLGNDKGLVFQTAGTNKSTRILPNNVIDNFASVTFYPNSGTNVGQSFNVIPRGSGLTSALRAQFFVFNSDFVADQTNWEGLNFRAAGTSYIIASGKGGTGTIRPLLLSSGYADGVTNANQLWLYTNGNVGINTTTNGSERLQVQGTTLLNGNVTFSSATGMTWDATNSRLGIGTNAPTTQLHVANNQNGQTAINVSNSTSGTNASVAFNLNASAGGGSVFKNSATSTTYKISAANDYGFYNGTSGDIAFLNDVAAGNIKFAAGGSSTAHMTLHNTGNLLIGSTTNSGERLQVTGNVKITGNVNISGGTQDYIFSKRSNVVLTLQSQLSGSLQQTEYFTKDGDGTDDNGFAVFAKGTPSSLTTFEQFRFIYNSTIQSYTIGTNKGGDGSDRDIRIGNSTSPTDLVVKATTGIIGINTTSPNASARLQVDSTTQGFLPPRMTNAQRTAISSPAVGLIVYCTDMVEGLYVYKSAGWTFVI
jgi:hypothetical protein